MVIVSEFAHYVDEELEDKFTVGNDEVDCSSQQP
jgi:hypothetical protein